MRNRLIVLSIVSTLSIGEAIAEDIHLRCNVDSTQSYSTGTIKRAKGLAFVSVLERKDGLWINVASDIDGVNNISVTGHSFEKNGVTTESANMSSPNTWDVYSHYRFSTTASSADARIVIDRSTGALVINSSIDSPRSGGWIVTGVIGTCEKSMGKKF
jgi:hypothetical protein